MAALSPARKAAFRILMAVERGHSHSDDLLRGKAVTALSAADRNLTAALVLGVLRWQIRLDHLVRALLARPNARLDVEVLIALRLGAFQLLFLDRIPAHAAIDESVELARQAGHRFASGMVNAVLRKLSVAPRADFPETTAAELALAYAHPAWMVERWVSSYGLDAARAICSHGQTQPTPSIRMGNAGVATKLAEADIRLETGQILTDSRIVVAGDVSSTPAFREGLARFQDEGSQLVAEIAAGIAGNLNQGAKNILDACAAPGGKTLILAERNPEARIVACESSEQRLAQLRDRLATPASHVQCRKADATALEEASVFDVVLADVPCSGTGTLGRNPEIRHRLRLEEFARQAERQRAILRAALHAVRPGGFVVYSTCSFEIEENEQVVSAVLAEISDARQVSLDGSIQLLLDDGILALAGAGQLQNSLTPEGALRLLPGSSHTDGFFIALIEKIA